MSRNGTSRRRARKLAVVATIAAMSLVTTGCWTFQTLDGAGGGNGATHHDVGLDGDAIRYNDLPHLFYYDATSGDLRHAYYAGSGKWFYETLDGAGGPNGRVDSDVGRSSTVAIYNGRPQVFYQDVGNGRLRHAYYDGTKWLFETLDGLGGANGRVASTVGEDGYAFLFNNRLHVVYSDAGNGDLRHAYYAGGGQWLFEVLDGAGGGGGRTIDSVGKHNALVIYNGLPHIFYWNETQGDLRHAAYNGSVWGYETLDGAGGPNGRITRTVGIDNAAAVYNGRPNVFYYDADNGDLRHTYYDGAKWWFETLDTGLFGSDVGQDNAALAMGDRLMVFYYDATRGNLRLGNYQGSWSLSILDGIGGEDGRRDADLGIDGVAIVYNGRPDVFYYDSSNGDLRHGWEE